MQPSTEIPFALFENNLDTPAHGLLLHDLVETVDCINAAHSDVFFSQLDAHTRQGHWIALIAHYELGCAFEPHAPHAKAGEQLARALIFRMATQLDGDALAAWWQNRRARLTPQQDDAGILHLSPTLSQHEYAGKVARVLDYIRDGHCYQTNLTFPLEGQCFGHPEALYARLRDTQPVQHGALIFDGEEWLLSRSPELFFERHGTRITCRPMKGTAERGGTPEADAALAASLQSSEKNRAENLMIVDLIRNDLGKLAHPGDVHVRSLFELERYATVFQLTSTVEAQPVDASIAEIFQALFPCGSITGAPKLRAMQILAELEDQPRGPYCGALGWIAPDNDYHFNVPIRTLRVQSNGDCRLDVGSGIVADSDPHAEYAECLTKARFVTDDNLQLIETIRCEKGSGTAFPHLPWHMQRMARSARALQFTFNEQEVVSALEAHSSALSEGTHRIRLLLARKGATSISSAPLDVLPEKPTIRIADLRIDPDDRRLQHKTTARSFYDEALREAMAQGHFDTIFLNTRGEVCEGTRSNIFIKRDGKLITPPLHCGVLPGTMRASLLESGKTVEAVFTLDELKQAEQIFAANALRGLIEVVLAE